MRRKQWIGLGVLFVSVIVVGSLAFWLLFSNLGEAMRVVATEVIEEDIEEGIALGMETQQALAMMERNGYPLTWDTDVGAYLARPIEDMIVALEESGGRIVEAIVVVNNPLSRHWGPEADKFFDAANLPRVNPGGVEHWVLDHLDQIFDTSQISGTKTHAYPESGIEFTYQMIYDNLDPYVMMYYRPK